ncbi:MAG: DUF983 domain-containing protein [Candidatus Binatia bacterium]
MDRGRIWRILKSGLCLKCPKCGVGPLFYGLFSMHSQCLNCSFEFEREQGYFVGAIYINYAATVIIAVPGYFILDYLTEISLLQQLTLWVAFALLFPLIFFRHSRSLWLTLDYIFNPAEEPEGSKKIKPLSHVKQRRARP